MTKLSAIESPIREFKEQCMNGHWKRENFCEDCNDILEKKRSRSFVDNVMDYTRFVSARADKEEVMAAFHLFTEKQQKVVELFYGVNGKRPMSTRQIERLGVGSVNSFLRTIRKKAKEYAER